MDISFPFRVFNRLLLVCTITGLSLNVCAQKKITLQQAIDSALENNLQVKQAQFSQALSSEDLNLSKAALPPSVNGNLAGYKLYGNNIDLSTSEFVRSSVTLL